MPAEPKHLLYQLGARYIVSLADPTRPTDTFRVHDMHAIHLFHRLFNRLLPALIRNGLIVICEALIELKPEAHIYGTTTGPGEYRGYPS